VVRARAIGVLLASKDGKPNHRVIAVSTDAKMWSTHRDLTRLPRRMLIEIERFFHSILVIDGHGHGLHGWRGAAGAERVIEEAIAAEELRRSGVRTRKGTKRGKPGSGVKAPARKKGLSARKASPA
ncbi:MAG: inorganic diphosphatase, partial [Deltaproteobacteria bacterium]